MSNRTKINPKQTQNIEVVGARVHNLKNINVTIPRNKFVVITGLSGSGKSSLAFDTLYAEGQRRYVESLSAYARQFLGRFDKPDVDAIHGISPAIAIEQKVNTRNPRSTVGTSTEIYDYIKLLFTRIGKTISPISGKQVKKHVVADVVNFITQLPENSRVLLASPLININRGVEETLQLIQKQGFSRIMIHQKIYRIPEALGLNPLPKATEIEIVIDRVQVDKSEENLSRIADSAQTAFYEGNGECCVLTDEGGKWKKHIFNNNFELDGITFEEPTTNFFSFNNPYGACKTCEGFGSVIGIDKDLVIPNKGLSVYQDAIVCWKGETMGLWKKDLLNNAHKFDFPVHKPIYQLTKEQYRLLWEGNKYFEGLNAFFSYLEENTYKIQYRVMLSRYRGKTPCPECEGTRLRKDANYVKINGKSISELVVLPIDQLYDFFNSLTLTDYEMAIAKRLLLEIQNRLGFLKDVGLNYLTLNRLSSTLSGGESQRINLATSLGSSLVGSTYILDEPSIGLHSRDTEKLIGVLKKLQRQGNTVLVVEHDEDIMHAADEIIDLGPMAGSQGGRLVYQGNLQGKNTESLTLAYLNGTEKIEIPPKRRKLKKPITIVGARENNLKNITVNFPLGGLICVTGVSGSGKSTLIGKILYPALQRQYGGYGDEMGEFDEIKGNISAIQQVEYINQNPIGKSSRSNPVTYIKAYDEIRSAFAHLPLAKTRGLKPSSFSFNVDGGRCDTCKGEGVVTVEMQFMADIQLQCETCKGKRFKNEVLEITLNSKNIADILDLTIDDAIAFFTHDCKPNLGKKIAEKLLPLQEVGLGYVKLGQASSTLSGGEAQRIKLASFLAKGNAAEKICFIFDEPTTGLHFHDIKKLLHAFDKLIEIGHSIVVIEHNLDVAKCADYIIDLGLEGGEKGGNLVFEGSVEEMIKQNSTVTSEYLKQTVIKTFK